jgi:hypothetical protein
MRNIIVPPRLPVADSDCDSNSHSDSDSDSDNDSGSDGDGDGNSDGDPDGHDETRKAVGRTSAAHRAPPSRACFRDPIAA